MRLLAIVTCLLVVAVCTANAQSFLGGNMTVHVDGFTTQGNTQGGQASWRLKGESADISASVTEIRRYTLDVTLEGGSKYKVTSHHCRYMNALREVKSSAPIHLEGDGIVASGIGYDLFLDTSVVRIRSNVKIDARRSRLPDAKEVSGEKKTQGE